MLDVLSDTWQQIQEELRRRAGDAAYQAWLQSLRPMALERGICYLEAPNRMVCDRVRTLFTPLLSQCLSEGFGGAKMGVHINPAPESLMPGALEVSPTQPVVDPANETAVRVLESLLEDRGRLPGQLFLFYGSPGVGKTFLLRWWADLNPDKPRVWDGLKLRQAFQVCIRDQRSQALVEELVAHQSLVIDGVHRFAGHARAQRELLRALRRRAELELPTLVTSRHHPGDTWRIDKGLQSHLMSGFVHEIQNPSHAARLHYLRALEGSASSNGRAGAVEQLARQVQGSYQDLREAWVMQHHGLDRAAGSNYLRLIDPGQVFRRILRRCSERLGVSEEELRGKGQARRITLARQALCWVGVQEGLSQAEIARHLGGRTRASVSYSIQKIERRMAEDASVRAMVEGLL